VSSLARGKLSSRSDQSLQVRAHNLGWWQPRAGKPCWLQD